MDGRKVHSKVLTLRDIPCLSPLVTAGTNLGKLSDPDCLTPPPALYPKASQQGLSRGSILSGLLENLSLESWVLPAALGWATSPLLPKVPKFTALSFRGAWM